MKTTTRLYDIIHNTYNNIYGGFIRGNQITYFNPEFKFTHKVVDYDDEIKTVCRDTIFYGLDFLDETSRQRFEQEFLTRFLSRTIKYQTYELFNWKLVGYMRGVKDIVIDYYVNIEKYLHGYSQALSASGSNGEDVTTSTSENEGLTTSRDNNLSVTLPQDNTDLSLDKDTYNYADSTAHSKSKSSNSSSQQSTSTNTSNQNSSQTSETNSFEVGRLAELQAYHDDLFNDLDRLLFSQVL